MKTPENRVVCSSWYSTCLSIKQFCWHLWRPPQDPTQHKKHKAESKSEKWETTKKLTKTINENQFLTQMWRWPRNDETNYWRQKDPHTTNWSINVAIIIINANAPQSRPKENRIKYLKTFEKTNRLALKWGQQFFDWPDDASPLRGR